MGNDKYYAMANTNEFGLKKGKKYVIENPKTGSVYAHDTDGTFIAYCRKDSFDYYQAF